MIKGKKRWVEQQSVVDAFIGDWKAVVPENSFEKTIFNWAFNSLSPDDFSGMFQSISSGMGRDPIAPFKTLLAMIYAIHYNLSDRLLERDTKFNIAAKAACGLDLTEHIDAATLCRHRKLFLTLGGKVLRKTVEALRATGIVEEAELVIIDSYAVTDACATMDTYTLLKSSILRLFTEITLTEFPLEITGRLRRDDYATSGKADIDWQSDEAKALLLKDYYEDARYLLTGVETSGAEAKVPESVTACATLLATVIAQNIQIDDDGGPFIPKGVAYDRVISTVDTESRHGRKTVAKKIDGYKSHIITDGEIVFGVEVTGANVPDGEVILDLVDAVIEQDLKVSTVLGDGAYGTAEIIQKLETRGIEPIVKVLEPVCKGHLFNKSQFNIDLDAMTCTCPAGVTTSNLYSYQPKIHEGKYDVEPFVLTHLKKVTAESEPASLPPMMQQFKFDGKNCSVCSLRTQCTSSKTGRTVALHREEELIQAHRELQRTEEFKDLYRFRSRGERINNELTHHGGRFGRYFGKAKILFQQQLVAAAHNLAFIARHKTKLAERLQAQPCPCA